MKLLFSLLMSALLCIGLAAKTPAVLQFSTLINRAPDYPPLNEFNNADEWEIKSEGRGIAKLSTVHDHRFFGNKNPATVKLSYQGTDSDTVIKILLKKPQKIPNPFNSAELYLWGSKWGYSIGYRIALLLMNDNGDKERIEFFNYNWEDSGPLLYHHFLREKHPASNYTFLGVEISRFRRSSDTIYFGPVCFFTARPNVSNVFAVTDKEARQGRGIIPFTSGKNSLTVDRQKNIYIFKCDTPDEKFIYTYKPATGTLADLKLNYAGHQITPFADGGLYIGGEKFPRNASLLSCRIKKNKLVSKWIIENRKVGEFGEQYSENYNYTMILEIIGKSMIINVTSETPFASHLKLGYIKGLTKPKLLEFPYLSEWGVTNGAIGPKVVVDGKLFLLPMLDHNVSNASDIYAAKGGGYVNNNKVYANGGSAYIPNTAGKRNHVDERIVLTVSTNINDVFPNIDNPPALNRKNASEYIYSSWPIPRKFVLDLYHRMGFEKLSHVMFWTSQAPVDKWWNSSMKLLDYSPEAWELMPPAEFKKLCHKYGYEFCVYEYLMGMQIGDAFWSRNNLLIGANGQYVHGCAPFFLTKPTIFDAYRAEQRKFLVNKVKAEGVYSDVITVGCPWGMATDYDAKVPGSASMRNIVKMYNRTLRENCKTYGKCWSEGQFNWLYAGNATGSYGSIMTSNPGGPSKLPLLPDFKLNRMNQLSVNIGLGPAASKFFSRNQAFKPKRNHDNIFFDQYLSGMIGYGNQCIINAGDYGYFGFSGLAKLYYMLRSIQKYYTFAKLKSIEYHDGKVLKNNSEAFVDDTYLKKRLRIRYESGCEIYINYNPADNWEITIKGKKIILPPYGFYAQHPASGTISASVLINGKRCEYAVGKNYLYMDTRKKTISLNGVTMNGAGAVKILSDKELRFIPLGFIQSFIKLRSNFDCKFVEIDLNKFLSKYSKNANMTLTSTGVIANNKAYSLLYGQKNLEKLEDKTTSSTIKAKNGIVKIVPHDYYINYDLRIE